MSRAGRRAWRQRLIETGVWSPTSALEAAAVKSEEQRARAMLAERGGWISAVGSLGWQREMNRRRAARIVRHRARRQT